MLNGLDEEVYLNVKISTQSQLLYTEGNSHYNEYQKFLYELCCSLHKKMGYRKISQYLNEKGYKTVRGCEFKNTHVFSIIKKGDIRKNRIKNLKSHKDYDTQIETFLSY